MNKEKEEHCHYSDLPSPKAYAKDDIDYDGMGNYGRFPDTKMPKPKRRKKKSTRTKTKTKTTV